MANTIESTTDEALLRSIIDGSITEFEDDTIITLSKNNLFLGLNNLTNLCLPNLTTLNGRVFNANSSYELPSLKKIDLPNLETINIGVYDSEFSYIDVEELNLPKLTNNSSNHVIQLDHLRKLKKVFLPKVKNFEALYLYVVNYIVLPDVINMHNCRYCVGDSNASNPNLKGIDLGPSCTTLTPDSDNLFYQTRCQNIEALILRGSTLVPLTKSLGGYGGTQSFGQSSTNHIYVPSALVDEYKSATNWSSYADIILPIEGSPYEHYWADGTPLGFSNNYGLIGYYDVADSSAYEALEGVRSHINSTTDSELIAYTANSRSSGNRPSDSKAIVPTIFYDNKYCNSPGALNIFSTIPFFNDNDVITIEFSMAINPSSTVELNYIRLQTCFSNKQNITDSLGPNNITVDTRNFNGFNQRQFLHRTIIVYKDGTIKGYINGVYKMNQSLNQSTIQATTFIGVGSDGQDNAYLGPVAIWNREKHKKW